MTPDQEMRTPEDILAEAIAEAYDHRTAALSVADGEYDKAAAEALDAYQAAMAAADNVRATADALGRDAYATMRRRAWATYTETTGHPPAMEVP